MVIYQFLVAICQFRQLKYKNWKFGKFSAQIWQQLKNAELVLMWICYLKTFNNFKLKNSINYLHYSSVWFDTKNVELKLKFSLENFISFLNLVILIESVKENWIDKRSKTQLLKHYLMSILITLTVGEIAVNNISHNWQYL